MKKLIIFVLTVLLATTVKLSATTTDSAAYGDSQTVPFSFPTVNFVDFKNTALLDFSDDQTVRIGMTGDVTKLYSKNEYSYRIKSVVINGELFSTEGIKYTQRKTYWFDIGLKDVEYLYSFDISEENLPEKINEEYYIQSIELQKYNYLTDSYEEVYKVYEFDHDALSERPTLTLDLPQITLALNGIYVASTYEAYDFQGNDISSRVILIGEENVNTAVSGNYYVRYEVTDTLGNTVSKMQTVTVGDAIPVIPGDEDSSNILGEQLSVLLSTYWYLVAGAAGVFVLLKTKSFLGGISVFILISLIIMKLFGGGIEIDLQGILGG